MPFTLFHLGPALLLAIPSKQHVHAPTLTLASVALDVEPLLVLVAGLNYPLHGYLHTFASAIVVGAVLGFVMAFLEQTMHPLYRLLLLEPEVAFRKSQFILAGVLGAMLHVLVDSPLYPDIEPFYPLTTNPLYGLVSSPEVEFISLSMGVLGMILYLTSIVARRVRGDAGKPVRPSHSWLAGGGFPPSTFGGQMVSGPTS
jgi:membrane-bound metal-dependent hydrolase YbcI (DUF457 family)